jgi:kynureninase
MTDAKVDTPRFDRGHAETLDREDDLASFRDRFAFPTAASGRDVVYLCGNSLGLMPKEARKLVDGELDDWERLAVEAHFRGGTPWFSYHEVFRENGARLVGALPGEVVMMNSLTVNLHLLMVSFYRPSGRRTKILIEESAFPSDRYAVASQAAWHGLDPKDAVLVASPRTGESTLRTEDLEALLDERGDEIALVLLSGINYFTGQLFDIQTITARAKAKGCTVGWDLAHAAGNVPVALHDWDVDFAAWCSYKYLNAGPGAVAGCFVHARHGADSSIPRFAGWWGNDPATRFRMHESLAFVPREGADGWQISNPSIFAMAPLRASLAIFEEAGMGRLRAKSIRLTGYLESLLQGPDLGNVEILTPSDPAARGCQLSLRVRGGSRDLFEALSHCGVTADYRDPDVIRVAPTPLYNRFQDVWDFVAAFRECVESGPGGGGA